MAKKFYWLRLKDNFFKSVPMKKLRKIAGGDTYTIIYLKMMLLSLYDEGHLYYEAVEESMADELALLLDEDVDNVKVTMNFLQSARLLEVKDGTDYFLVEVPLLIGGESESAERVRKYRENKRLQAKEQQKALHCNDDVTGCNTEKRREEKDKEIEKEKNISCDFEKITQMYSEICTSLPQIKLLSDKRKKLIKAIDKKFSLADIQTVFEKTEASDFLTGRSGDWACNFDWLMNANNFVKVLEGNYDNKAKNTRSNGKTNIEGWFEA